MELKDALKFGDKLIIGSERTLKFINEGKIKEVFVSSNCHEGSIAKLENSSKVHGFKINRLKINSEELGASCRRPHSVAMLGLLE